MEIAIEPEPSSTKQKTEFKMFIWYIFSEPWRKIKRFLKSIDDTITPEFMVYIYFIFTVILFWRNWRDPTWIILGLIIIVVLLRSIWRRKKFIHTYRKEKYKIEEPPKQ